MTYRTPLMAACALAALAAAMPAWAQDNQDSTLVEELVVSTERRAESVQDVPLAVTAIDAETRENLGIMSIQDMAQMTPGLGYNTGTDRPSIRGIARQSNTFSLDSPVANYIDGAYTSSVQDASRRPIFIERTEILRGPQGALSGRGSIAGAINTVSARPDEEFGGAVGVLGGNYGRYGFEATVTGPITSWMRGRINFGRYRQDEGYFTNVATGGDEGTQGNNRQIQDYMLEFDLGENFDLFLKAAFSDYDETRRSGGSFAPYQAGSNPCTPNAYGGSLVPLASYGYFQPGVGCGTTGTFNNQAVLEGNGVRENPVITTGNLRLFNNNYQSRQKLDDHHSYIADLEWHAPWAEVRYIGAHQNYIYTQLTDADDTPVNSLYLPTLPGAAGRLVDPNGINMYQEERMWFSHELTATSNHDGPLQWIAGLYQSYEDYNQQPSSQFYSGYPELNTPLNGVTFAPVQANAVDFRSQYGQLWGQTRSSAAFGQVDFELSPQWKITGGLRYNIDEKQVHEETRLIYNTVNTLAGGLAFGVPVALDITGTQAPGYSAVNPYTAIVPAGYRLVNVSNLPIIPGVGRILPNGGGTLPIIAAGPGAGDTLYPLLAPGVVGLTTTDPVTGNRMRDLDNDWQALTGSLGVNWTPNDDTLIYARVARGYRPGGFNSGFITSTPQVDNETLYSYELGGKTTVNGQLRVNGAAYYYDYSDIQLPLATYERCTVPGDLSTCTAVNSFVNLPEARNMGLELEALWMPTDNWQVTLSYSYLDAEITNGLTDTGFENGLDPAAILPSANRLLPIPCTLAVANVSTTSCLAVTPGSTRGQARDNITGQGRWTQDLTGNPVSYSPKHKIGLNVNYTFQDVFDYGDVTVSGSYLWRDESYSNLFGTEEDKNPSYNQVNLRAILRSNDDKYQVIAYVQNLLDDDVVENGGASRRAPAGSPLPAAGATGPQIYYRTYDLAPPRLFGLEVQRRF